MTKKIAGRAAPSLAHDPEFSRRSLLVAASALGLGGIMPAGLGAFSSAHAAKEFEGKSVTFTSWGGSFQDAQKEAYCAPFAARTGATVLQAGPMDNAKLRTMVQGGDPVWDVVDVTIEMLYNGAKDGMFEKIDRSIVHTDRIDPLYLHDYGVGDIVWSYNIAYSTTTFTAENHPRSWAEVFDLKRFPGTRLMRDRVAPMLEVALMADGVAPDKLYPLDADRAFKKLDTIKKDVVWWTSGAESIQNIVSGNCAMGVTWHGRPALRLKDEPSTPVGTSWKGVLLIDSAWAVPKGAKHVEAANALLAYAFTAKNQCAFINTMGYGIPVDASCINDFGRLWGVTSEHRAETAAKQDADYYAKNIKDLIAKFNAWITS